MKKVLKIVGILFLLVILTIGSYLAYVFIDFHRIPDNQILEVQGTASKEALETGKHTDIYKIVSWNIGFGAYTKDFGFFMDGGTESRGKSEKAIKDNLTNIALKLREFEPTFSLIQEVDIDSTRAYHVDEKKLLLDFLEKHPGDFYPGSKSHIFALNYDSPYLFYPITEPHGATKAGLMTISPYKINSAVRRSLPIQTGFAKFMDLDRCYTLSKIPVKDSSGAKKELVLINLHLSAYTTDPTIVESQLDLLYDDMKKEYAKGNYVIAGGDFNKDLLGDSSKYFGVSGGDHSWAKSYPFETIPNGFSMEVPFQDDEPVASCRNADGPWDPKTQFHLTIDGFLVSDNVEVINCYTEDTDFRYSDHNPVMLDFMLK